MKTIWKFPLDITDTQWIAIPSERKLLTVQMQGGIPCLWALVDPESPRSRVWISIIGTGTSMSSDPGTYIATFQVSPLVFHVFEEPRA